MDTVVCRFEAGTPAIGEAVGLGAAVDYLNKIGMDRVHEYEVIIPSETFKLHPKSAPVYPA